MSRALILAVLALLCAWPCHALITGYSCAIGGSPGAWRVEDDFATDTLANYTAALNTISYDYVNYRMKGSSNLYQNSIAYHETAVDSADQEVVADLLYTSDSTTTGILIRCDGNGATSAGWAVKFVGSVANIYTLSSGVLTYVTGKSYPSNTWVSGENHKVKVTAVATTLSIYVDWDDDGVFNSSNELITNSTAISSTPTGLYIGLLFFQNGSSVWADNLQAK